MIRFKGKKLKGLFHLIRLKDDNQWLLTKSDDQFADKTQDILHQDQSIKSGKTLQQITKQSNKKKKRTIGTIRNQNLNKKNSTLP